MAYIEKVNVEGIEYDLRDSGAVRKDELLDLVYPVGSIYMNVNNVDPSIILGGEWEAIEDKFILASGKSYSRGSIGGSPDSVVVSHRHSVNGNVSSAGAHIHTANTAGAHVHGSNPKGYTFLTYSGQRSKESIAELPNGSWQIAQLRSQDTWSGSGTTSSNGDHSHSISSNGAHVHSININSDTQGISGVGRNMPPYLVVNVWKRVN